MLKIYFTAGQVLFNEFRLKFLYPSVVHNNGVQCDVSREQLSIYYTFYTPQKYKASFFWPKNQLLVLA
jgi:hypothetical protein